MPKVHNLPYQLLRERLSKTEINALSKLLLLCVRFSRMVEVRGKVARWW
jgi:hypothetical protein